jgi:hypothetical protein
MRPAVKAFLSRVAPENLAFLQEWVGYHLLKDYRFQRCVVLVGEGDNGKSTFLSLLTRFLGPENVTGQSLYRLSTNRFAPAELQGRYLRNGPNPIGPVDPATHHWFTGDGMVHGIRLQDGRADWYHARWCDPRP